MSELNICPECDTGKKEMENMREKVKDMENKMGSSNKHWIRVLKGEDREWERHNIWNNSSWQFFRANEITLSPQIRIYSISLTEQIKRKVMPYTCDRETGEHKRQWENLKSNLREKKDHPQRTDRLSADQ